MHCLLHLHVAKRKTVSSDKLIFHHMYECIMNTGISVCMFEKKISCKFEP